MYIVFIIPFVWPVNFRHSPQTFVSPNKEHYQIMFLKLILGVIMCSLLATTVPLKAYVKQDQLSAMQQGRESAAPVLTEVRVSQNRQLQYLKTPEVDVKICC